MMLWSAVALIFFTLLLGLAAWLLFMWAVKSGQFDDIEGPKYRMMDDDDEVGPIEAPRPQPASAKADKEEEAAAPHDAGRPTSPVA